jgi:hypothetical protein
MNDDPITRARIDILLERMLKEGRVAAILKRLAVLREATGTQE